MRLRTAAFFVAVAASFALCHLAVTAILPASSHGSRRNLVRDDWFLAVYGDFGIDYYVMRFGLLGVGEHIKKADIICSSSSKGLYGFDADLLAKMLSTSDHPVRVYNLSFGFGEGVGYLMECVKSLDLHDQILVMDLADNSADLNYSNMAQLARQTRSMVDAWKIVLEKNLTYQRDLVFQDRIPKIAYDKDNGFQMMPHVARARLIRSKSNGNVQESDAPQPREPWIGEWDLPYHFDHLRAPFFEECQKRNIRIIFTSIPTENYDPVWGRRIAQRLDKPHVTVDPRGIELMDACHMSAKGRQLFSSRLAEALLANEETAAMIHGKEASGGSRVASRTIH